MLLSESVRFRSKQSRADKTYRDKSKHFTPSASPLIMSAFLLFWFWPDQTVLGGGGQSDKQIEEEQCFQKAAAGRIIDRRAFHRRRKNLLLHGLINKAETEHQTAGDQARRTKTREEKSERRKKWSERETAKRRTGAFLSGDVHCIHHNQSVIMVNHSKERLLQPAIINNDTFSSVSAQGRRTVRHTDAHTHTHTHILVIAGRMASDWWMFCRLHRTANCVPLCIHAI